MIEGHHLKTRRTARYYTVGGVGPEVREIVYAFHGYGQLAGRFAQKLEVIADAGRLLVVPEALSRFYVRGMGREDPQVGASWMTREDREHEIEDQLRYLDDLHRRVLEMLGGTVPLVSLLGFSQGTATAGRWLAHGTVKPSTLVLWAGRLPPELEPQLQQLLSGVRVVVAVGGADQLAPAPEVALVLDSLRGAGVRVDHLPFDGGHELDATTLRRIFPVSVS